MKCARSFSTSSKRELIHEKVSNSLKGRRVGYAANRPPREVRSILCGFCGEMFDTIITSQKFCSVSCGSKNTNSGKDRRDKMSIARIEAIKKGHTNHKSIRCFYPFQNEKIRCDSKLEYACLDWFERNYEVLAIRRCEFVIRYEFEGLERRYLPDFTIDTTTGTFIVEAKDISRMESLNKKWRRYNQMSPLKKEALLTFTEDNGFKAFWFTSKTRGSRYRKLQVS